MQTSSFTAAPGWYSAQGDPPGTHRYWDGVTWVTGPRPIQLIPVPPATATAGFPGAPPQPFGHQWAPVEYVERNPWEWFMYVVKEKYATFDGRATPAEYWWFTVISWVLLALAVIPTIVISEVAGDESSLITIPVLVFMAIALGLFLPTLAVTSRRLHDTGRSRGWYFISIVPFGGLVLLIFLAMDGDRGPNQYGPDPKGIHR